MTRVSLIAFAAALALALPASAIAQSAGDNQYQDPLATPHHGSSGSKRSSGGSGSASQSPSQGSSSGSAAGTSGSSGTGSQQSSSGTSAAAGSGRLPRTGGHPGLGVLLGLALLTGGIGLRRAAGTGR